MKLLTKFFIIVLALLLASNYISGIEVSSFYIALIVAVILGVVNLVLKPILIILTLPINIITFGLFTFVINGFLFWFVATFVQGFEVMGIIPALLGALIISIASWFGNRFL